MAWSRRAGNHKVFLCVLFFLDVRYVRVDLSGYEAQLVCLPSEIKLRYSKHHIRVLTLCPQSIPIGVAVSRVSSKIDTLRFYHEFGWKELCLPIVNNTNLEKYAMVNNEVSLPPQSHSPAKTKTVNNINFF